MATKRVHEIAKEQNLSSKELLETLQAAGLEVKAAQSAVEEADALRALAAAAAAPAKPKPVAPKPPAAAPARPAPAQAGAGRVSDAGAGSPSRRVFEPDTPAEPASARRVFEPDAPAPPRPRPRPRDGAGAQQAPRPRVPVRPAAASLPSDPRVAARASDRPVAPAAPAAQQEPAAQAPAEEAPAQQAPAPTETAAPQASAAPAAPAKPAKGSKPTPGAGPKIVPSAEPPAPGTGPKIISVPEPPQRPKRDETRPGGTTGPGGGPGGKRRVVIDSQAARRPGGPGGGPGPGGPPPRRGRRRGRRRPFDDSIQPLDTAAQSSTDMVRINSGSTVKDVAEYLGVPVPEVIKQLMGMGEMATLTQTLSDEAITILAEALEKKVEIVSTADEEELEPEFDDAAEDLVERPPVVTIMGHVDHGKTSLLDAIREADVVAGEAGGITQHIGAYQVHHNGRTITFLDTPGHEAFTAMRARGARVTDVAVVVVAADDGPKPQTDEAIDHAKAAEVPIIVAVNKIDKEGADPTRVRTEMTTRNLQPSDWGGETEYVDVSAKTRQGLDELLETILVVTELEELKANPGTDASGVVIESKLDPGRGPVVTVLIQRGTLRVGDALVAGSNWGRVRAMVDYTGARVDEAVPGDPVEVLGFDGVPDAGESVRAVANDRAARQQAGERAIRVKNEAQARRAGRKVSFDDLFKVIREGDLKELNLVLKADVSGSLEAFEDEIAKLPQDEVVVNIIHSGVGGINESDVILATASDAVVLGFNVRPVGDARQVADREGVEIRTYAVIYKALDDLRDAMSGMLEPEEVEETLGSAEVRATFKASRIGTIAGCQVTDGKILRGAKVRVVRDGTVIYETTIDSLKRHQDDVREVAQGFECGIVLANFQDVKEGDVLEAYTTRQVERKLETAH